ncbi:MAG: SDR family NAD(P)-dependent oxidoreductase [Clostridia bacterium]
MKNIAIISGASSGMGKKFCELLDAEGFDEIWGIALKNQGLVDLKNEIKTPVKIFAGDLTTDKFFSDFSQTLSDEKPNVLFLANCSGFGKFGRYDEINILDSLNMIDLNCKSLVHMTEMVLPFMTTGARIVQIASVAAFQPVPFANVYAASKAFVLSYSRALNVELKPRKISVTTVCPYWTKTQFFKRAVNPQNNTIKKYVVMYDPQKVISKALKDAKKRKELSIYGFIARSQVRLVKMFPHKLVMKIWTSQQKLK